LKWLLFMSLTALIYVLLALLTVRRRAMQDRLTSIVPDRTKQPPDGARHIPSFQERLRALTRFVTNRVMKRQASTPKSRDRIQSKLGQAGNPMNMTALEWIGLRVCTSCIGVVTGGLCLLVMGGLRGLLLLLVFSLFGWVGPDFWLSRQVTHRQSQIVRQLPSALDLLTVSVEAGLGFDQALSKVAQKLQGPLAEEFARTIGEIQLGSQRTTALQRLASRTGADGLKSFISAIIQADKLGTGLTQVLRIQSATLRERRRLEAQERAMKAPIKMLFPLVLFVFPAVFVVILGPAILHVIQLFSQGGI
jgi:tight adherence protein C